jgi:probable phosphoglycerate mutase
MTQSRRKRVLLIRHAQSASNAGLATSNPTKIPLTQKSIVQGSLAASTLDFVPDLIISSPFLRARQTAAPFVSRFGVPEEIWPVVQEFVYVNFRDQVPMPPNQRTGPVADYWKQSDPYERHSGGESFGEFWERVLDLERRINSYAASRLLIVSHGFFMICVSFAWKKHGQLARAATPELMQVLRNHHTTHSIPNCHVLRYDTWLPSSTRPGDQTK